MQDPVQNRRIMGIGRVNLVGQDDRLHADRPGRGRELCDGAGSQARPRGLLQQIGRYEFWAFDLVTARSWSAARRSTAARAWRCASSSNGKLLYIYQAGATIDVYDAATYKKLRTIEMNADQTTELFVVILPRSQH